MIDVGRFLADLGLQQYAQAFADNAIDGDMLRTLGSDDLKELGVLPLGHRKRLLEAIAALSAPGWRWARRSARSARMTAIR
jgi:hypothetical protein